VLAYICDHMIKLVTNIRLALDGGQLNALVRFYENTTLNSLHSEIIVVVYFGFVSSKR
jgi:hypothetical protein